MPTVSQMSECDIVTSHQTGTCSIWVISIQKDGMQGKFPLMSYDLAIWLTKRLSFWF